MYRVANFQHFGETFFKSPNIYVCVCVSSSCRASGPQMSQTAPVWPSTTSTDWWRLAAPGTVFFFLSSFSRTTSESQFWVDAFVSVCYREQSLPVWCVCVLSKTLSVCVCTGRLVCACQKVLLDSAVCQSAGTPPPPPQSPSFLFFLV